MDYKEELDNQDDKKEIKNSITEDGSHEEICEREKEISSNIEIIQENLLQIRDSVNPNIIFNCINTISNMLNEKYGKEYIEFLINMSFMDIIFPKINTVDSYNDSVLGSSLQLINIVLSRTPKNSISKFPYDEYLSFLFDQINDKRLSRRTCFSWNALDVLIKSNDHSLNMMVERCWIEELQRIVYRIKSIFSNGDDDDSSDDSSMLEEEEREEVSDTTLATIWIYLMKFFYDVIEGLFATMNDESRHFYIKVCIYTLNIPQIPPAQKNGLKGLLFMSDISPAMIIEMIHNDKSAIGSIFETQDNEDQEIVELGIHLIYKLICFAPDAFNIDDVAKYVFNVTDKFGWSEATKQFEWATRIISKLCEIPELQKVIIPDKLLIDADSEIGEASYELKRILVNMLCNIFIHGTKETKDRLLNIYNFIASICDATSNIDEDNEDADLIVFAIAEITKVYVLISWDFMSMDDFCDLVNRDFIEEKAEDDSCKSSEAAKYIMSVLDGE